MSNAILEIDTGKSGLSLALLIKKKLLIKQ